MQCFRAFQCSPGSSRQQFRKEKREGKKYKEAVQQPKIPKNKINTHAKKGFTLLCCPFFLIIIGGRDLSKRQETKYKDKTKQNKIKNGKTKKTTNLKKKFLNFQTMLYFVLWYRCNVSGLFSSVILNLYC